MSEAMLKYNFEGLMASAIFGEHGLERAQLDERAPALEEARAAILSAHERGDLGFLDLVDAREELAAIQAVANARRSSGRFTQQIVIGIGGSSLGALAILESVADDSALAEDGLETYFSENIDPNGFARLLAKLDLEKTLVVVITKSGTTIETMSKFWILYDRMVEALGEERAGEHVIAITDPVKGSLRPMAERFGFETFPVPPEVGGRFSVLTSVGLLPLALAGYDIEGLLDGAREVRDRFISEAVSENAPMQAALHQILLAERGVKQVVMMSYCDRLLPMVDWFRQLWAESLGKRYDRHGKEVFTGITPLKALGVIDQHSQVQLYAEGPHDKHICFLEVERIGPALEVPAREGFPDALGHLVGKTLGELLEAELEGTKLALRDAKRPTSSWRMGSASPEEIGAFVLSWEISTAVAGELLDIDAFDQPGVELGKKIAHGLLGRDDLVELAASYTSQVGTNADAAKLGLSVLGEG